MMMPWVIQQKATNFRVTYGKGNLSNACPADTVNWILNMCDIASLTVSIGICALLPNYFTINQVLALCHQPVALWRDFPGISKLFGFRKFLLFRKGDQVPLFTANRCQNSDLHHSNWNNPLNVTKDSSPSSPSDCSFPPKFRRIKTKRTVAARLLLWNLSQRQTKYHNKRTAGKTAVKIHEPISHLLGSHPDKPGPLHLQIKIRRRSFKA